MAWTAAHSTKVLFTNSVPLPVRNRSRTKAWTTSGACRSAPGARRDAQAAGVGGERLRALDAGLDLLVEGAGQVVAVAAEAVVAQAGRGRGGPPRRTRRPRPARCRRAAPRPIRGSRHRAASIPTAPPTLANSVAAPAAVAAAEQRAKEGVRAAGAVQRQRDADAAPAEAAPQLLGLDGDVARVDLDDQPARPVGGMEPGIERGLDRLEDRVDLLPPARQQAPLAQGGLRLVLEGGRGPRRDAVAARLDLDARHRREQPLALGRRQAGEVLEQRTLVGALRREERSSTSRARSGSTRGRSPAAARASARAAAPASTLRR